MAGAIKYMERSHRNYKNRSMNFSQFHNNARLRVAKKENASIFAKLFHRTTEK